MKILSPEEQHLAPENTGEKNFFGCGAKAVGSSKLLEITLP